MWGDLTFLLIIGVAKAYSAELGQFTTQQLATMGELKTLLKSEVKEEFILEDYFLGEWLQAAKFNVMETAQQVRQYHDWREKQNMSSILNEDWTDMRALFPYSRDSFTKNGEPVLYIDSGKWDVSSYFAQDSDSSVERLSRYVLMFNEESFADVRKLRAEGKSVNKFTEVVNLGGFGLQKHACLQCLSVYRKINQNQPPFQTMVLSRLVLINVPFTFKAVYSIFGEESEKSLYQLYGQDPQQWEQGLLEFMDKDQFPKDIFGEIPSKDNSNGLLNWDDEL